MCAAAAAFVPAMNKFSKIVAAGERLCLVTIYFLQLVKGNRNEGRNKSVADCHSAEWAAGRAGRGARGRGMHADRIWDSVLSLAAKTIGLAFWTQ